MKRYAPRVQPAPLPPSPATVRPTNAIAVVAVVFAVVNGHDVVQSNPWSRQFVREPLATDRTLPSQAMSECIYLGLGLWPTKVSGLLANANGNVNEIEASDGKVLTNPFPFEDL